MIIRIIVVDPEPKDARDDTLVYQVPEHSRAEELLCEMLDERGIEWIKFDEKPVKKSRKKLLAKELPSALSEDEVSDLLAGASIRDAIRIVMRLTGSGQASYGHIVSELKEYKGKKAIQKTLSDMVGAKQITLIGQGRYQLRSIPVNYRQWLGDDYTLENQFWSDTDDND